MSLFREVPFGFSSIDLQGGTTADYWEGVRAQHEALMQAAPNLGAIADAGAGVETDFVSVDYVSKDAMVVTFEGFPTAQIG